MMHHRRQLAVGGGEEEGIEISNEGGEALEVGRGRNGLMCCMGSLLHGTCYSVTAGSSTPTPGAMAVTLRRRRWCSGRWHFRLTDGGTDWRASGTM
jgi:hypothetical protein